MAEQPPPVPAAVVPVLSYAGPRNDLTGHVVWREGSVVVARQYAVFPPRCVRCNAPVTSKPNGRAYYWHHWSLYLLLLLLVVGYAIAAVLGQQRGVVYVYLCRKHQRRRYLSILIGWLGIFGGIALMLSTAAMAYRSEFIEPTFFVGLLMTTVSLIVVSYLGLRLLHPKRIDRKFLWLAGAGRAFLESLPESEGL